MTSENTATGNPLLQDFDAPYGLPPFAAIKPEHFAPAFKTAFANHLTEIQAIADSPEPATFENTIVALERSGRRLIDVSRVFFNLTNAHTNPELQKIERDVAPKFADHQSKIYLNGALFRRVDEVFRNQSNLALTPEDARLLEQKHKEFVRQGAQLSDSDKNRVAEISARLATLATNFSQNVLKDEQDWHLLLRDESELAGLPDGARTAARRAAEDLGHRDSYAITLARSSIETFLQFSKRRDLRETAYRAWINRGRNGGDTDNRTILKEIIALRSELARLLGFESYAAFAIDDQMAKTPTAVRSLLDAVWTPARQRAQDERDELQTVVQREGGNFQIAAWDWRYFSVKVRAEKYQLNDADLRPYFALDNMVDAAFYVAGRLFGLEFKPLTDMPVHHPDVRAWEVTDHNGDHIGVFLGDYYARASKHSGAWMSSFRVQHNLGESVRPIVVNTMNFAQGGADAPTLLSFDDARTLFHEFGHGLHGLLSNVTYPSLSGTNVARDFVELPSQLFEHWLAQPEILKTYARHSDTGEAMPDALIARIKAADKFNQGFASVEYLASAIADLELHQRPSADNLDVDAFEDDVLRAIDMPAEVGMRHRLTHFGHIIGGYAAGYYSYLWSEVMDADAFQAFVDQGDIFDSGVATRLKQQIYAAGDRQDPEQAYIAFRGRKPTIDGLLKKRGFAE